MWRHFPFSVWDNSFFLSFFFTHPLKVEPGKGPAVSEKTVSGWVAEGRNPSNGCATETAASRPVCFCCFLFVVSTCTVCGLAFSLCRALNRALPHDNFPWEVTPAFAPSATSKWGSSQRYHGFINCSNKNHYQPMKNEYGLKAEGCEVQLGGPLWQSTHGVMWMQSYTNVWTLFHWFS